MKTEQNLMAVDPSLVVAVTLREAEVLRLEAAIAVANVAQVPDSLRLRDLSPLGRNR